MTTKNKTTNRSEYKLTRLTRDQLEGQRNRLHAENEHLHSERDAAIKRSEALERDNFHLRTRCDDAISENQKANTTHSELREEINSMRVKVLIAIEEARQSAIKRDDAERLIEERNHTIARLEAARVELVRDNTRLREMGPKIALRAVSKTAAEILEYYDDGIEGVEIVT